jgi:hypothetical protein
MDRELQNLQKETRKQVVLEMRNAERAAKETEKRQKENQNRTTIAGRSQGRGSGGGRDGGEAGRGGGGRGRAAVGGRGGGGRGRAAVGGRDGGGRGRAAVAAIAAVAVGVGVHNDVEIDGRGEDAGKDQGEGEVEVEGEGGEGEGKGGEGEGGEGEGGEGEGEGEGGEGEGEGGEGEGEGGEGEGEGGEGEGDESSRTTRPEGGREESYAARQIAQAKTYGEAAEVIPHRGIDTALVVDAEEASKRKVDTAASKKRARLLDSATTTAAAAAATAAEALGPVALGPTKTTAPPSAPAPSLNPLSLAIPMDPAEDDLVNKILLGLRAVTRQAAAAAGVGSSIETHAKRRRSTTYDPTALALERLKRDLEPLSYFKVSMPCLPVAFGIVLKDTALDTQPLRLAYLVEFCTKMSEKYGGNSAAEYNNNIS